MLALLLLNSKLLQPRDWATLPYIIQPFWIPSLWSIPDPLDPGLLVGGSHGPAQSVLAHSGFSQVSLLQTMLSLKSTINSTIPRNSHIFFLFKNFFHSELFVRGTQTHSIYRETVRRESISFHGV